MVVAVVALILALGGTSYAALTLPRNSVGATQLRTGAVRSSEVKDRSLQVADLSRRARSSLRGERGPAGPPGTSAQGAPGGTGAIVLKTAAGVVPAAPVDAEITGPATTASCDPGQRVTGGGVALADVPNMTVHDSFPSANGTAWTAHVGNDERAPNTFTVYAICVP
jgi:hypothetical protein